MSAEREAPQRRDTFGAAVNGSEQRLTAILAELRGLREDVAALAARPTHTAQVTPAPAPPPPAPIEPEPKAPAVDVSLPGGETETVPAEIPEPDPTPPAPPPPPAKRPDSKAAAKRGRR